MDSSKEVFLCDILTENKETFTSKWINKLKTNRCNCTLLIKIRELTEISPKKIVS